MKTAGAEVTKVDSVRSQLRTAHVLRHVKILGSRTTIACFCRWGQWDSASWTESMTYRHHSFQKLKHWTQDVSYFPEKSTLSVLSLTGSNFPHYTLAYWAFKLVVVSQNVVWHQSNNKQKFFEWRGTFMFYFFSLGDEWQHVLYSYSTSSCNK